MFVITECSLTTEFVITEVHCISLQAPQTDDSKGTKTDVDVVDSTADIAYDEGEDDGEGEDEEEEDEVQIRHFKSI